jgi:hypothetical protein
MTAAVDARLPESAGQVPTRVTLPSAANQLFYKGTMVSRDANGRAVVPTADDGLPVVCVANATYDNRTGSENGGANDSIDIEGMAGVYSMKYSGTQPKVGQKVFSLDNQTVSVLSNTEVRGLAGYCCEVTAELTAKSEVMVHFGPFVVAMQDTEDRLETI